MSELDRRGFLRAGLAAGAGAVLGAAPTQGAEPPKAGAEPRARVVAATSTKIFRDDKTLDAGAVRQLVDAAVCALVGEKEATAAWKRLVKPDDTVGIKVNCLAGERLSTRIEVVRAIADGVRRAGVPPRDICVWDRLRADLVRAGYPVGERDSFTCVGNDMAGFDDQIVVKGEIGSMFSKLVTDHCSVLINVPVFKDHDLAGVSIALKSAFGAIHNPNKYHFGNLQQAIVDVNRVQFLTRKTVIHICDATFGCYNGGPTPAPRWVERLATVYASRDPVALDATAWQRIEELRKANGLASLVGTKREPKHIGLGAQALLGTSDPARIDLVKVEV